MALIPPFFLDCVVSIGVTNQGQKNWIGTGFIVGRPFVDDNGKKLYNTFFVTNKHILENKQNIILRFNSLEENPALDYPIDLCPEGQSIWVGHISQTVDIAVFYINSQILQNDSAQFRFFRMDEHTMSVTDMRNCGVSEGDGIFVLGFPMGIVAPQKKYVIARTGAIARIRDVIEGKQASYLIDATIFPGNSGGPVVIRPEAISIRGTESINKAALIGIVKSYVLYEDVAISQQTGKPRVIFEENSGLALVETVDNIESTVNSCFQQKRSPDGA